MYRAFAFDEALSTRSYDSFGRLHVAATPISKATVNSYLGREIPGWQKLGLDPNRSYRLLRDPRELQRAAPSANNLPILTEHVGVTADRPRKDLIVGSTGTDAKYVHPHLMNTLVIWSKGDGIAGVENGSKRALSMGYSYRPDMTPGVYEGQRYGGVMRDIAFNHCILCATGRAGPDIIVGDSISRSRNMPTEASWTTIQGIRQVREFLQGVLTPEQFKYLEHLIGELDNGPDEAERSRLAAEAGASDRPPPFKGMPRIGLPADEAAAMQKRFPDQRFLGAPHPRVAGMGASRSMATDGAARAGFDQRYPGLRERIRAG